MADIAKPKRDRKKRSRFTDASPERDGDAKKSGSSEFEGNVSSTESEDSETEAMVKFKKSMQKAQLKQKKLDDDVNKRDWGRGANKKSKRRRRRDSSSDSSSSESSDSDSDDSRRKRRRKKKSKSKSRKSKKSRKSRYSSSSSSSDSRGGGSSSSLTPSESEDDKKIDKKVKDSKKVTENPEKTDPAGETDKNDAKMNADSDHSSDVEITGADVDPDGPDVQITGASYEELVKQTKKLTAKMKSQEAKRNYNRFFIRTAKEEVDLTSNETIEERDARSIFVQQIHHKVHARDLHEFFSSVGNVHEVSVMCDEFGKRSKGLAYIEFGDVESVPLALGLSGQRILGVPIMVKLCQGDRNRTANTTAWTRNTRIEEVARLYVGNLHANMDEIMLRRIMETFGKIKHIRVERDQTTGESKEFAHVTFKSFDPSRRAKAALDGFSIGGRKLKIQFSQAGLDKNEQEEVIEVKEEGFGGGGDGRRGHAKAFGSGIHAKGQGWDEWVSTGVKKEEIKDEEKQFIDKRGMLIRKGASAKFDILEREETDRSGIHGMSRTEKVRLMARLAEGTDMIIPKGAQQVIDNAKQIQEAEAAKRRAEMEQNNTNCFMIKHFFHPDDEDIQAAENEAEWKFNLSQDIIEETTDYGGIVHIHIDGKNTAGIVYLKAPTNYVANEIITGLHGRFFGGRVLEAARIPLSNYNELFADSVGKDKLLEVDDE